MLCKKSVQQIQASTGAFAAILIDGSVVTWGWGSDEDSDENSDKDDSRDVQDQLKGVQQIKSFLEGFCSYLHRRIGCYLGQAAV